MWQNLLRNLEARVKQLETAGQEQNPDYVPAAMSDNPDLMYNAHFVKAAAEENTGPSFGTVCLWLFFIVAIVGIVGVVVYFLAVREY